MAQTREVESRTRAPRFDTQKKVKKRNLSLNGLKALAIIAIILYHLDVPWLQSGHLGVVIFLVMTGYFFTRSLLKEIQESETVVFTERILKRIARMWPAVAILVIAVGVLCISFNHVLLTKMKPDILPGLTFTLNIANVVRDTSYFDNFGGTSPLLHLWYLGVDIQFCILWPYIMYMMVAEGKQDVARTHRVTFMFACISAAWMAYLYVPGEDPSRIYYSLDTRIFSPLIGACAALYPRKSVVSFNERMPWVGPASVVALFLAMIFIPKNADFFYWGGMFLASILTAFVILCLTCKNPLSDLFRNPVLANIGDMSLSLYLWHFPIILLLGANTNTSGILIKLLAIVLTGIVGYINYRVVEKGSLFSVDSMYSGEHRCKVALVVLFIASMGIYTWAQFIPNETLIPEDAMQQSENASTEQMQSVGELNEDKLTQARKVKMNLSDLPSGKICLVEDQYLSDQGIKSPFMIGDSVPTAIHEEYAQYFPNGKLDAKVSRRPDAMQELLESYLKQGVVGDVVILQAFNNTTPPSSMLDEMVEACGDREVYLVNIKVPESIEGPINRLLIECAEKYDNVHVIDWNSLVANHMDEYLWADHTHLKPNGAEPYVNLLANSIAEGFAKKGGYVLNSEEGADYREKMEQIDNVQAQVNKLLASVTVQ